MRRAGIGGEVTLKALASFPTKKLSRYVIIGDFDYLRQLAKLFKIKISLTQIEDTKEASRLLGQVGVIDTRSLDLSIDETLHALIDMIKHMKAKRVVIDSLSGFELALAPEFSEDFRGSLYRMITELTGMGMTILMTSELEDRYTDLRFSPFGSAHSKNIRLFDITDKARLNWPSIST